MTLDELVAKFLENKVKAEKRNELLEFLITNERQQILYNRRSSMEFKGSRIFTEILNRLILYYEKHMIEFEDIYYDGKIIETKQLLKSQFLNDKVIKPMAKRLKRIEIFSSYLPLEEEGVLELLLLHKNKV